jgi:hypothetical protein
VTLSKDKVTVNVPASVETNASKYSDTILGFNGDSLTEIRIGGTKTHIVVKQP